MKVWKVELIRHVLSLSQWDSTGQITCDRSHVDFDLCIINGPTLLDPTHSTLFILGPYNWIQPHYFPVKLRPYPRKHDTSAMSLVNEITLSSATPPKLACNVTHHTPALLFSAGGYTGNFFHEINENFIPLFITVHSLFHDQELILVISDINDWWAHKYKELLSSFTPYPIIYINKNNNNVSNDVVTHCFSSVVVGLVKHGPMMIDPKLLPSSPKGLVDFRNFLKDAYTKNDGNNGVIICSTTRPNLTVVSRRGNESRLILNQEEIIKVKTKCL